MASKVAGGFIIYKKFGSALANEYLLLQTSYGSHHWTPPKGHMDPGETLWDAAVRETKEEAGLEINKDYTPEKDFELKMSYLVKKEPKQVTYWLGRLTREDAEVKLSHEHQDYKWLQIDEACKYARFDDMIKGLRQAESFLSGEK